MDLRMRLRRLKALPFTHFQRRSLRLSARLLSAELPFPKTRKPAVQAGNSLYFKFSNSWGNSTPIFFRFFLFRMCGLEDFFTVRGLTSVNDQGCTAVKRLCGMAFCFRSTT